MAQFGGLGLQFAAAMAMFTYAGYRLDRWLGTDPWLTVVLALVGAGAAFYFVYRKVFPRTPPEGR